MHFNKIFTKGKSLFAIASKNSAINGKFVSLRLFELENIYNIIFFLSSKFFVINNIFESNSSLFNKYLLQLIILFCL